MRHAGSKGIFPAGPRQIFTRILMSWPLWLQLLLPAVVYAQQVGDPDFRPPIDKPAFAARQGPLVLIDEAHFNFNTAGGRYLAFAELLRRDGYVVEPLTLALSPEVLQRARILVVANALHQSDAKDWSPPNPSAFTEDEIAAVQRWVKMGGSMLLIADHMPFAAAANELAKAFGIRYLDGYASMPGKGGNLVFRKLDETLRDHEITRGIDAVATFTGSSFLCDSGGQPLLVFGSQVVSMSVPMDPNPMSVAGHLQGAVLEVGAGRVAAFGEAGMFSAQLVGPRKAPMGMNSPIARQNAQFVLNVLHWLTRL